VVPACGVLTAVVIAHADAPPGQYDNFDQADTVITDAKTGLHWQRQVTTSTDFNGAVAYCSAISVGTYTNGWRLPSYKELLTLVDESPHVEYTTGVATSIAIDGNAFPETPISLNGAYWSSSVTPLANVLGVQFTGGNGVQLSTVGQTAWVRCVHD
jgi:hypothetical protein